jgi:phage terminase Nu1 subunit (DNA packaging protein)
VRRGCTAVFEHISGFQIFTSLAVFRRKSAMKSAKKRVVSRINGAKLGEHLDMTGRRARQLAEEGVLRRGPDGLFDQTEARVTYIRWLRNGERLVSRSAAASRLQNARAREVELRTARDEHRLIDTDEAIACCDEIVGTYKSELAGLPARLTRDVDLRRKVETEIDDICRRVAERFAQRASDLRARGEISDTSTEDDV